MNWSQASEGAWQTASDAAIAAQQGAAHFPVLLGETIYDMTIGAAIGGYRSGKEHAEAAIRAAQSGDYTIAVLAGTAMLGDAAGIPLAGIPGEGEIAAEAGSLRAVEKNVIRVEENASGKTATKRPKWEPGDDPHAPTRAGNPPSDSTVRRREWKNEADNPTRPDFTPTDIDRMQEGKPPQRYNPEKPSVESMERSHEPIPKREGGTVTVPKWPQEHAEVDPYRRPGY